MGSWFSQDDNELQRVKKINQNLRRELRACRATISELSESSQDEETPRKNSMRITRVSREKLLAWVDHQLENPDSNISWMPDGAERQLKTDIFMMMLSMFDHILETTKIEVMGHQITIDLV